MDRSAEKVTALDKLLARDRYVTMASIFTLVLLSWAYLLSSASSMSDMAAMPTTNAMQPVFIGWDITYFTTMFLMWAIMMVGMMLPSAAPMILLYGRVARQKADLTPVYKNLYSFMAGYLLIWTGFSLLATILQYGLESWALLSLMMVSKSTVFGGCLLIMAGLFQLSSLKNTCLNHCRMPGSFLARYWRNGPNGALMMGLHHGLYCVGCCWALMLLLFVGGVMNLLWILILSLYVLLEKLLPFGKALDRLTGLALIGAGAYMALA